MSTMHGNRRNTGKKMVSWVKGPVLGKGSYGDVCLVSRDGKSFAVKSSIPRSSDSTRALLNEEGTLTQLGDCPYVVKCLGHEITYEKRTAIYNVFLEYLHGGNLRDYITCSRLPESVVRSITSSLVRGLAFIHAKGYVHCDIKPDNILLSSLLPPEVKICDFGLAKRAGESCGTGLRGTLQYMSPEAVTSSCFEQPMDVWALGCVVLQMCTGQLPWECRRAGGRKDCSVLDRIASDEEYPDVPSSLSDLCKDFLNRCFVRDAEYRWTADMLLDHPFLQASSPESVQAEAMVPSKKEDDILSGSTSEDDDDDDSKTSEKNGDEVDESAEYMSSNGLPRKRQKLTIRVGKSILHCC